MKNQNIHVVHKGNSWAMEEEGAAENATVFDTRALAVESGREMAKQNQVELIVHRMDGTIDERDSYGNDPRDIPG